MDADAVRFLSVAVEVARARNGEACEPRDLVVAYVIRGLTTPDAAPTVSAQNSASPDQIQLSPQIEAILTLDTDAPVVLAELLTVAGTVGPELKDYLGVL
ncbi:hypothetical protein ACIPW5_07005 [Streptomyces sp. NPDC090077]|uniref:hypothetical protein n=1 Tax=Streptomyces sp. NPDC090077 TaxID=3365938 RepID=UPI0037F1D089